MRYSTLGEVATYINGKAFKPSEWSEDGLPIIRIQNLTDPAKPYNYFKGKCDKKYLVSRGDILISWSASLGLFEWNETDAYLNQHIFKVDFNKEEIDKKYFKFIVSEVLKKVENHVHGSTMKHITKGRFDSLQIPLPSLPVQRRIAEVLDKADAIRRRHREMLKKYDALAQSVFLEMFGDPVRNERGWETVTLNEVCTKITDGTHKTPNYTHDGVPFLSAKNIKNFELNTLESKNISAEEHKELIKRCKVERGDILITKSGSLGMAAINHFDFEFSIFESLALIKFQREKVIGKFLVYFLNTPSTKYQYNRITKGVGVKHLHLTDLRKIKIILPPLSIQNKFTFIIEKIEKHRKLIQEELNKSETLFQSSLQRAFRGELFGGDESDQIREAI